MVEEKARLRDQYRHLLTIPGIGEIPVLTIMLETGPVSRFPTVGDYVSYCRKVNTKWKTGSVLG
jgi:transposase